MHHPDVVHVAHGGHEPPHDVAGFRLAEVLLLLDALEQLAPVQELHHQESMKLGEEEEECGGP